MGNLRANPLAMVAALAMTGGSWTSMAFSPLAATTTTRSAAGTTRSAGITPQPALSLPLLIGKRGPAVFGAASDPNQESWMMVSNDDDQEQPSSSIAEQKERQALKNPTPALIAALQKSNLLPSNNDDIFSSKAAASFVMGLMIVMATTFASSDPAWAAMSGGRVGGGGYGRSSSAPSMSRPAPSRSYYGGGGGYSSSYRYSSRPNVYINPGPTIVAPFSPVVPFAPVVPLSPYGGGAVAISRGPSLFDLAFFGAITFMIVNAVRGAFTQSVSTDDGGLPWTANEIMSPLGKGTTVAQISVALQVPNRDDPNSILNVLPRMAQNSNTERRAGLQNLTSQVALELLRRKSNIVSASTSYQHFRDRTKAEQAFGQISIRERSKFEKEGFSKFRGADWGMPSPRLSSSSGDKATMAVVTLLIDIDGDSTKLPNISSIGSVEDALRKIASDTRVGECLQSAEILWTPEDRSETLTQREIVADYPELRSV